MKTINAGDIHSILIDNRVYNAAQEGAVTLEATVASKINLENEVRVLSDANHVISKRKPVGFSGLDLIVDSSDYESLVKIKNSAMSVPVVVKLIDGTVYSSEGLAISGTLEYSSGEGKVTLEMKGRYFERL